MKYELIDIFYEGKGNVALIERKTDTKYPEYAVVRNLDRNIPMERDDQWDNTIGYWHNDMRGLASAVDCFLQKTDPNYITRARLEELATRFKDYAFDVAADVYDTNELIDDLVNENYMTDWEITFFDLQKADDESED